MLSVFYIIIANDPIIAKEHFQEVFICDSVFLVPKHKCPTCKDIV